MNGNTPPQGPAPFREEPPRPYTPPTPPSPPPSPFPRMTPPPPPSYNPPSPQPQSVPPPPPPEVGVRTMVSDSAGMRESGGMQPQPKTFRPEDLGGAPVFRPREPAVPGAGPEKPAPTRMILIVGGAVLFLLVAAAVFYFFVRPILSPSAEILPAETAPPAAETPLPVQVPPESETPPAPAVLPIPPVPVFTHQSLLNPVPKLTETLTLSKLELAELTSAIGKATGDTQPAGSVKELVLANAALGSGEALGVLLPDLDKNFSDANLEKDFTAFAYYDANGVWPGYVFQLKSGIEAGAAKSAFVGIEASKNWPNFYLVNPGTPAAFKDGAPISGNAVRYLSYTKAGASFNYSFLGNYLVLSTSYSGFKEAAKLLGF